MRKWEDIVKDKMEGYESTLPQGSLESFRALRNAGTLSPGKNRFPAIWVTAAAAAACVAAVLLIHHPSVSDESVPVLQEDPVSIVQPVAKVEDASTVLEPYIARPVIAQALDQVLVQEPEVEPDNTGDVGSVDHEDIIPEYTPDEVPSNPYPKDLPVAGAVKKPVRIKVAPAAGVIAGGGMLAAVLSSSTSRRVDINTLVQGNHDVYSSPILNEEGAMGDVAGYAWANNGNNSDTRLALIEVQTHYRPLKAGLSTRFPVSERLNVTTGLEYSLFSSRYEIYPGRDVWQQAHYLGIPVRLDWTIASNNWLEAYLGGGFAADYCLAASLGGDAVGKDGISLSTLGAVGLQFNITRHFGVYLEPEISWTVPSDSRRLETYRSEHPLMFSLAGGLRVNLRK